MFLEILESITAVLDWRIMRSMEFWFQVIGSDTTGKTGFGVAGTGKMLTGLGKVLLVLRFAAILGRKTAAFLRTKMGICVLDGGGNLHLACMHILVTSGIATALF